MRAWTAIEVAAGAQGTLERSPLGASGPLRAVIDSRQVVPGDLFVAISGEHFDGGAFVPEALAAGAWGAIATPRWIAEAAAGGLVGGKSGGSKDVGGPGALIAAADPVAALGHLARAWRRELGAAVIGITGSTGKTSTKDILAAMLSPHRRTFASPANHNTEIGLPLCILDAPPDTEVFVLEMGMRGLGEIAELVAIAEPDVGVIVNVGPGHLELLGTIEAIAEAKAELIRDLPVGSTIVIPSVEPLLAPHLTRDDIEIVTFGDGGDVALLEADGEHLIISAGGEMIDLQLSFTQAHQRSNALAAVAAARAIGVLPSGRVEVAFSALREQRIAIGDGIVVINDCYNANPVSMRAALDDLAVVALGRRVAVLGDMLELGPDQKAFHLEIGRHAASCEVDLLVTVGSLAAAMLDGFDSDGVGHAVADAGEAAALVGDLAQAGDTILVKGSRGVALEVVAESLLELDGPDAAE
ncbi:MAG: UDP-N-acetylmuramoyl-tripeptide--D-alanyl-D-alanine ligase [Actinomycetota bacterium]